MMKLSSYVRPIKSSSNVLNNECVATTIVPSAPCAASMPNSKKCSHCKEVKTKEMCPRNKGRKDGRGHICSQCASLLSKESRARHGASIRRRERKRYRLNREAVLAKHRKRYRDWVANGSKVKECPICGTSFKSHLVTCSKECANKWKSIQQKGKNNPWWKGGKYTDKKGYVHVRTPGTKNKNGYEWEHRLVMEKHLKRKLFPWELVHHRNGIKNDNRISNLEVVTHATHTGNIRCPNCRFEFCLH